MKEQLKNLRLELGNKRQQYTKLVELRKRINTTNNKLGAKIQNIQNELIEMKQKIKLLNELYLESKEYKDNQQRRKQIKQRLEDNSCVKQTILDVFDDLFNE